MSEPEDAIAAADGEAAEWHVRLGERPLSASTLAEFRRWRAQPHKAAAYQRLEAVARGAGRLARDADIQAVTRDALRASRSTKRAPTRSFTPVAAVLLVLVLAGAAFTLWAPSRHTVSTGVGEQRLVRLDDGSTVRLDTDTRLRIAYVRSERRVILERGQALFGVAHNPGRPFRVVSGEAEVMALGTTFDVRRDEGGVRVTLVEGSVAVTDAQAGAVRRWRLSPGQQVETGAADAAPQSVDAEAVTGWAQGRLVFKGAPLREAVDEVNRYLPEKIALTPGPASEVPVNGVFEAGDRAAFVSAVSDLFGLQAIPQADGSVRLTAPSAGG